MTSSYPHARGRFVASDIDVAVPLYPGKVEAPSTFGYSSRSTGIESCARVGSRRCEDDEMWTLDVPSRCPHPQERGRVSDLYLALGIVSVNEHANQRRSRTDKVMTYGQ